jgi:protein SCO1/2
MRSNLRGDAGHACGRSRVSCIGLVGLVYLLTGCGSDPVAQKVTASNASATEPAPAPTPKVQTFEQPEQLADELAMTSPTALELPDVTLVNQAGESVRLHALLDGKIVVIQTMFTTCGTICPPLGANFARLQSLLVDLPDVVLVSISVDPITDTPERLRAWGDKFGAGPSWTLLTGSSSDIGKTLKALRVFSAEREQHSSMVVLGDLRDQGQKRWTRIDGLSEPSTLLASIQQLRTSGTPSDSPAGDTALAGPVDPVDNEAAHHYFTDIELVDHLGRPQRLYTDLLRGKIVLVNSFFTSCAGVCPPMTQRIAELQAPLADRLGKDVLFLSLTVDPITDTTETLAAYAEKFGAKDGWLFLGGSKRNVDIALRKLGFAVEVREAHSNVLVVGNEPTGLWKKAFSMATPEQLLEVVQSVIDDRGP